MNKFDVIFSNPPYNRGLDLKIVNEVKKFADKMVIVMTNRVLFRSSLVNERKKLDGIVQKIIKIENSWKVFKLVQWAEECIWIFNTKKKDKKININDQYQINSLCQYNTLGELTKEQLDYVDQIQSIKSVKSNLFSNCTQQHPKNNYKVAYYLVGGCDNNRGGLAQLLPKETRKDHIVHPGEYIKEPTRCQYRFFLYFNNDQQVQDFKYSYRRPILRWYVGNFKYAHTIAPSLLKRIPFVRGKLQNQDWKRILQMPDSLYQKILKKYG